MRIRSDRIVHVIFRILFTLLGVAVGRMVLVFLPDLDAMTSIHRWIPTRYLPIFILILFAIIFFILGKYVFGLLKQFIVLIESEMKDLPAGDILWGFVGLVLGIFVAYLVSIPVYRLNIPYVSSFISLLIYAVLGILGIRVMLTKREEFATSLRELFAQGRGELRGKLSDKRAIPAKILDTSVIIDGRIVDIIDLGFIEEPIVVPTFVLAELQGIADSSNAMSRTKGRKGLDSLKLMQNEGKHKITIVEKTYDDLHEVDDMLMRFAKETKGIIVTNDFNLNKVAEVQGIGVLNINALANAMKPVFVNGERINVFVVKPGSQDKQGLGYLDDGTMIVVENGIDYLGETIDCVVTSMLQTSAGKMIFARPVD